MDVRTDSNMTVDPGQLLRNVAYGVFYRSIRLAGYIDAKWHPDEPNARMLKGTLETGLADLGDSALAFGPAPSVQTAPVGLPVSPPPPPPPPPPPGGQPQWVKPGSNYGFLSCPNGYDLIHIGIAPEIPAFSCQLSSTPVQDRFPLKQPPLSDIAIGLPG